MKSTEKVMDFYKRMLINTEGFNNLSEEAMSCIDFKAMKDRIKFNNIYLLQTTSAGGKTLYKVGYSSNMIDRLFSYYSANPFTSLLKTTYIYRGLEVERYIHKNYKSAIGNEWYEEEEMLKIRELIDNLGYNNYVDDSIDYIPYIELELREEKHIRINSLLS